MRAATTHSSGTTLFTFTALKCAITPIPEVAETAVKPENSARMLHRFSGQGVYSVLCTLERAAGVRQAPAGRKWGRLVASERQPKQPSSCPDTPPTHDVPLLPVWPTAGLRARLRRKLVTAVVTPVHRCDGCLSDRDKQASLRIASPPVASADAQLAESSLPSADRLRERAGAF